MHVECCIVKSRERLARALPIKHYHKFKRTWSFPLSSSVHVQNIERTFQHWIRKDFRIKQKTCIPEVPTNEDRLPTHYHRKASSYRQAIELPKISAKLMCDTPYTPYCRTPLNFSTLICNGDVNGFLHIHS